MCISRVVNFYANEADAEAGRETQHCCGDGGQDQGARQGPAHRGLRTGGHLVPADQLVQVCVGNVVVVLGVCHQDPGALLGSH